MFYKLFPLLLMVILSSFSLAQTPPIEPGVSHDLAIWRAARYSDVRYKLNLTLEKMSPVLKGTIEIRVTVSEPGAVATGFNPGAMGGTIVPKKEAGDSGVPPIVLDWRKIRGHEDASTISNVSINGTPMRSAGLVSPSNRDGYFEDFSEHLIFRNGVVAGENVIKLDFTSPILTSGSAITRYIDKEDGSEYLYSLFVPSDASTAFPVFDQPDLKARFKLTVSAPKDWRLVSNSNETESVELLTSEKAEREKKVRTLPNGNTEETLAIDSTLSVFRETQPLSTYVFAFAAGPWVRSEPGAIATGSAPSTIPDVTKNQVATAPRSDTPADLSSSIYVRKSQAQKFKPHAAETFRLMREGVKYLEGYFDYKFPWPKYDLVLIPEFPFGGMEHAGATFVREQSIIFPTEPTKSDYINRATLIFHETAHQWFGDTVTMKWFDDLWLKEGFANFMAYKAMEKIMPEMNSWKVFYERIKQPAYATDSTKGTTPIYQPIANLSAAKSAYGNIVYNKAPAFLRQAEFYLGEDKFQASVRAFLKKHEYANGRWEDLVSDFARAKCNLPEQNSIVSSSQILCAKEVLPWADAWIKQRGVPIIKWQNGKVTQTDSLGQGSLWSERLQLFQFTKNPNPEYKDMVGVDQSFIMGSSQSIDKRSPNATLEFANYQDYGYGIFLLDDKSRDYVLKNVQNEKDPFLRSMMYGALWDSVREGELDPKVYVELAIRNLLAEQDENITASILGRVGTAMNYYMSGPLASAGGQKDRSNRSAAYAAGSDLRTRLEAVLIDRMQSAPTLGQRITFYRAFLNLASTENARSVLKGMLKGGNLSGSEGAPSNSRVKGTLPTGRVSALPLKAKDKFDIVTRLASLGDPDAEKLLADLEKTETSDDAKRYAYAAHAAFATKENREKFWNDFVGNKTISESWIEAAMGPFNSIKHDDLSLPYLQRALAELPNLKRDRKIFFVNGWLGAFIGGQKSQQALDIVNKFLADNPNLDNDLRLKILENVDVIERAVKIRAKFGK